MYSPWDLQDISKVLQQLVNGQIDEASKNCEIDVVIDFTQPKSIYENAKCCLAHNIKIVIGTTGLTDEQINELEKLSKENNTGCFIAPNFSTGAVLMMKCIIALLFTQFEFKVVDSNGAPLESIPESFVEVLGKVGSPRSPVFLEYKRREVPLCCK